MAQQHNPGGYPQEEEINLREELDKYLKYWPWFAIGVIICVVASMLYLRYSTPQYSTTASIIIKDEKSKGPSDQMEAFADMGFLGGMGTNSIENEIGILKSKTLMTQAVKALNLNLTYFQEGRIKTAEVYENLPFRVHLLQLDEKKLQGNIKNELGNSFKIVPVSKEKFQFINTKTEKTVEGKYGTPLDIGFANITVAKTGVEPEAEDNAVQVHFNPISAVIRKYRGAVQVNLTDKNSSLLELSLVDPVKEKAQDILDQLILEYNRQAIEDKNLIATNTAEFIDERLDIINEELDSVEVGKEEFKEANQLTNIEAESELFIQNASEYKKRQQEVGTQLELANAMIDYLKTVSNSDLLPANLGIEAEKVNEMIKEYNSLVLERNRILSSSTKKNPVVVRIDSQIEQMQAIVLQSLQRMRSNLEIAQEDLNLQAAAIGSQISAVPSKERRYRGIERQQNIKESLYIFLLEKREENSLSLAVTAPKAKIVDGAYSGTAPVSPKSKIILLAAIIVGFLIPFLIIYLKNLLNNKVTERADLEKVAKEIPIVGEIPRIAKKKNDLIKGNDHSVLAEAFRIMATNLQYLLVNSSKKEKGIKLFVTSTVKGEGKTFVTFNLGITFANLQKKVIIVGGDLRNPQLQRYETKARKFAGVSNFIFDPSIKVGDVIKTSEFHPNMDVIASGDIPPNPAELLRSDRMKELLNELEIMYDYIIVDTAPAMLVADTFLINQYADLTLYLVRAGYTEKRLLDFPVDAKREGKLHHASFVLNDVEMANFGYGNKYGYAYGKEKQSFWQKLKNKAAM